MIGINLTRSDEWIKEEEPSENRTPRKRERAIHEGDVAKD